MSLFRRSPQPEPIKPIDLSNPIDWDAARRVADAVNRGDLDEADRICEATGYPRETAFAAFRFID
ncbi:hypothetical protein [Streptomyces sp. NPDC020983]|uniref:hypothetical protein n=1 Tax=Streptomyces sp. NPDC020983 TaxID=3365106 RepID=UPI0037B78F44